MKSKIFILLLFCFLFTYIIIEQSYMIKVPREDRNIKSSLLKSLIGKVESIIDGDTFVLSTGENIRLYGVEAPEIDQTCIVHTEKKSENDDTSFDEIIECGKNSKDKLTQLLSKNQVYCVVRGVDAYNRYVADCNIEKEYKRSKKKQRININKEMILTGNAVAFTKITDKYVDDENRAKIESIGIWATDFINPSEYRKQKEKK